MVPKINLDISTNLLITGGSQGSCKLNAVCFEAISASKIKDQLQIIHICGVQDFAVFKEKYASTGLTYQLFDFFTSMQYAYSLADLIICRAGATTIAELQRFKLPAVLIPYPFAYAHQLANAKALGDLKAALTWVVSEAKDLINAEQILQTTQSLITSSRTSISVKTPSSPKMF